ncbi:MAG: MBOAT family protein [Ruminococcaceae bacterium]|nr:MBOAT family protein [Oscillospiraceae bacterium]
MVFSSMTFVPLFLPLVLLLYYSTKHPNIRNGVLLAFSLLFYAWGEPKWILVMLLTVTVNYLCGLLIDHSQSKIQRTASMVLGVSLSLGFLVYFKYFGFFSDIATSLLGIENTFRKPVLPIGISFYTFQVLTYTVDVYRGKVPVQKSYGKLLMYVSFFPQLIAGPIVNYTDIAPSLGVRQESWEEVYQGFTRFFIGLAKKVLLANTCGVVTDKLTGLDTLSVAGSWLIIIAYAFQIYFDFSGYSDMAIGMGHMFGFHFFENFNYPYISKSITEFWRRWHISLGTFFRDYVYIPLGGNRVSTGKHIRNILIVWILTGFWHGASWNFIVWGTYYGILLLAEKFLLQSLKKKLPDVINTATTLLLVLIGWVFFYYEDLSTGLHHLGVMFGFSNAPLSDPWTVYYFKHNIVFLAVAALACYPWKQLLQKLPCQKALATTAVWLKPLVVTALFLLSMAMVITQSYNPFLYFRF